MRQVGGSSGFNSGVGINAIGQVLISSFSGSFNGLTGFLTGANGEGGMDLGYLPNVNSTTSPIALNNTGEVVGEADPVVEGSALAFLYSHAQMNDLNNMIDPAHPLPTGTILTSANAISNTGKIVASGSNRTTSSTWLLTPCAKSNACGGNIFWRNSSGDVLVWYVSGDKVVSTDDVGNPGTGWSIAGSGDFMGTGDSDIV
jgi:probable HAF family extracellular repeat protein